MLIFAGVMLAVAAFTGYQGALAWDKFHGPRVAGTANEGSDDAMSDTTDWQGRLVPPGEPDDKVIKAIGRRWLDVSPTERRIRLRDVPGLNKIPTVHVLEGRGPAGVDWVCIAADAHPDAAMSLVGQCRDAGVPCWHEGTEGAREMPK